MGGVPRCPLFYAYPTPSDALSAIVPGTPLFFVAIR